MPKELSVEEILGEKFGYFREFFENPGSFRNDEFYKFVREWCIYIDEHKDDFNYLEDDVWKEIRERLLDELYRREDIRDEFYEFDELFDNAENLSRLERRELQRNWLDFMKRYQFEHNFTDEQIRKSEELFAEMLESERRAFIASLNLKLAQMEKKRHDENLYQMMLRHDEKNGKLPPLTSLIWSEERKRRHKGN